jgi:diguanylate cyclase (GGDEF)-like protein
VLWGKKVAMSDTDIPQHNPEGNGAPAAAGVPVPASPQPAEASASSVPAPQGSDGEAESTTSAGSRAALLGRVKHVVRGRRFFSAVLALLCLAVGVVASILAAQTVARDNATTARQAFPKTSSTITSSLKQGLQHDEDLIISASTFFAGSPTASARELSTWVKWARTLRRYPELQKLGLVALVRAPELAAYEARISGRPLKPPLPVFKTLRPRPAPPAAAGMRIIPAGKRGYYCLTAAELTRSHVKHAPAGLDYCPHMTALLPSRDSAVSLYTPAAAGHSKGLAIDAPVYRGFAAPSGRLSRRGAFVGWMREVLVPGVVLDAALRDHPGYALGLRYKSGSSNVAFSSGTPQSAAQSRTINLHNGWVVTSFGPAPAGAGVLADGDAVAVLIGGLALSGLLALVILLLGSPRRVPAKVLAEPPSGLPREALYDPLTRLPNRALMLDRAERMLARATRQSGLLVGALFIDIDWFKDVNEKLGQGAGDQLLKIVAERLENVVREHDTVGRLGGDEFVVLVESAARGVRLDSLARRVIEALHKPVELDGFGPTFALTASIGVAFGRYATPEDLLRDAQLALHAAQAAGRDRYTLFNANMRSVIEGRGVLEIELNTAIQEKQFFLLYQPIYDLSTRKVAGLEALIRWQHPSQGVLPPEDFVPLAKETGLIVPIGRWALEEACSRAAAWNVAGHQLGISVKVSATQVNRDGFVTDVRRALQQSGVAPSRLTLEIAESTVMRDVAAATVRLEEIRQLGVRIAIDEFGNGYAHHSDLQRMPLDFLRVDTSRLAASDDDDYRSWLLQAILVVGRDLSLPVIATGIETYEQLTALQAMGCSMAQGFLMGKPTPAGAIEGVLNAGFPTADAPTSGAPTPGAPMATPTSGAPTPGGAPAAGTRSPGAPPVGAPAAGTHSPGAPPVSSPAAGTPGAGAPGTTPLQ